jgi:hypothetical protein
MRVSPRASQTQYPASLMPHEIQRTAGTEVPIVTPGTRRGRSCIGISLGMVESRTTSAGIGRLDAKPVSPAQMLYAAQGKGVDFFGSKWEGSAEVEMIRQRISRRGAFEQRFAHRGPHKNETWEERRE